MSESEKAQRAKILDAFFERYDGPSFSVRLWDQWSWTCRQGTEPVCTFIFNSKESLRALLVRPSEITLGDAFVAKEIEVEGDLFSAFDVAEHIFECSQSRRRRTLESISGFFLGLGQRLKQGRTHSIERDRAAISYHYDQPVEFYRPWLGDSLAYSCGYFESPADSVDTAQSNKLELICRKLRLQPGERFLDVGCGWGSLVLHAASKHKVRATGITISRNQAAVASARIEQAQLGERCGVELLDYRTAPNRFSLFDKIASVGMFEHVGFKKLPLYFEAVRKLLRPGGVFLNTGIARSPMQGRRGTSFFGRAIVPFLRDVLLFRSPRNASFIDKYVFPDGEIVTISQALKAAEGAGFEVRDVENLREHYELTLRRWVEGLQRNAFALLKLVPETTYRIWLLYMAGSVAAFRRGDIAVYQTLLSNPEHGKSGLPLRREDWYRPSIAEAER